MKGLNKLFRLFHKTRLTHDVHVPPDIIHQVLEEAGYYAGPIEVEKRQYSRIEDYRSQIEGLYEEMERLYEKADRLTTALNDIVTCNIPDIPRGVTVGMEQFGPFARDRAERALKEIGYYK